MLHGVSCTERENEANPSVIRNQDFGIQVSHSPGDLLHNVNIETNAPQTLKRGKPIRIRTRNNSDSVNEDNQEKGPRSDNSV